MIDELYDVYAVAYKNGFDSQRKTIKKLTKALQDCTNALGEYATGVDSPEYKKAVKLLEELEKQP